MSRPGLTHRPSSVASATKTIVLVTGAHTGVGYQTTKSLAKNANFQILLGAPDVTDGEEAAVSMGAHINVNPIQLDTTDDESIEHCFLAIEQTFGKLDILIHAATSNFDGGASMRELYDDAFSVNATSVAILTERLAPLMEKSKLAKLIFVSSSAGSIQGMAQGKKSGDLIESSSKAAMNMLAVHYAKKLTRWQVNAVAPGREEQGQDEEDGKGLGFDASRVVQLALDGPNGVTGTFSSKDGTLEW